MKPVRKHLEIMIHGAENCKGCGVEIPEGDIYLPVDSCCGGCAVPLCIKCLHEATEETISSPPGPREAPHTQQPLH